MVLTGRGFGRILSHKDGALMNETNFLQKRLQRDPYLLPPSEDTRKSLQHPPPPAQKTLTNCAGTLNLDFQLPEL